MQTNFKKNQLQDPEIENSEKIFRNVCTAVCVMQLALPIKFWEMN